MKRAFAYVMLAVLMLSGVPVYAGTSGRGDRTLSYIEFSDLPQNHGLRGRILDRKYEEYRRGRGTIISGSQMSR